MSQSFGPRAKVARMKLLKENRKKTRLQFDTNMKRHSKHMDEGALDR